MSQPKRYSLKGDEWGREQSEMVQSDDGGWIWHADYAALAAENERLKDRVEFLERAERFQIYDHDTKTWVARFSEPK